MCTRFSLGLVLALAAVVSAACEKVPLLAPTESNITITATDSAIPTGGSTTVIAFVTEQAGTPVQNGTFVTFTASLGTVSPASVETRDGRAQTTFTAGSVSGTARIRATSGAATGGTDSTNVVDVLIGSAAVGSVSLTASPSRVGASGGTVTLIASAFDAAGNRLVGVPISFSTTAGTLSATTATTDANGEARVTLTTNTAGTVTARSGSAEADAAITVAGTPSVTLAVSPASPLAGTPVTLTVTPAAGTRPRVVIQWGDGSSDDLGTLGAARSVTHTYASSGSYTITATATEGGESFVTSTSVTVGSAAGFTFGTPSPASPTAGTPLTLPVTPTTGASPKIVINWGDGTTTDLGTVSAARTVAHTYTSSGTFVITGTGTSGNDTHTSSITVTIAAKPAISVSVTSSSSQPDRCSPVTFTAAVSGDATASVSSYKWEIDSNVDAEDETVTNNSNTLTRAFTNSGTKTISVTAATTDGRSATGQTQIVVKTTPLVCP